MYDNRVVPNTKRADYTDKVVVIRKSFFSKGFDAGRNGEYDRRFIVESGFGVNAVYGTFLIDGEEGRVEHNDIEGIAVDQAFHQQLNTI
jgi:hypothetical protein